MSATNDAFYDMIDSLRDMTFSITKIDSSKADRFPSWVKSYWRSVAALKVLPRTLREGDVLVITMTDWWGRTGDLVVSRLDGQIHAIQAADLQAAIQAIQDSVECDDDQ